LRESQRKGCEEGKRLDDTPSARSSLLAAIQYTDYPVAQREQEDNDRNLTKGTREVEQSNRTSTARTRPALSIPVAAIGQGPDIPTIKFLRLNLLQALKVPQQFVCLLQVERIEAHRRRLRMFGYCSRKSAR
jgi:hypothetical protein